MAHIADGKQNAQVPREMIVPLQRKKSVGLSVKERALLRDSGLAAGMSAGETDASGHVVNAHSDGTLL